jgi:integrase/recombinase XerD
MTPLRQRFIEDMQLRGLAPTTQRSYIHYIAEFAKYFNKSPEHLDLEAVRQYELYLLNERKMAPESVNCFVAAIQRVLSTGAQRTQTARRAQPAGGNRVFRAHPEHQVPRRIDGLLRRRTAHRRSHQAEGE